MILTQHGMNSLSSSKPPILYTNYSGFDVATHTDYPMIGSPTVYAPYAEYNGFYYKPQELVYQGVTYDAMQISSHDSSTTSVTLYSPIINNGVYSAEAVFKNHRYTNDGETDIHLFGVTIARNGRPDTMKINISSLSDVHAYRGNVSGNFLVLTDPLTDKDVKYRMAVVRKGSRMYVYVDDALVLSASQGMPSACEMRCYTYSGSSYWALASAVKLYDYSRASDDMLIYYP